jgi:hypothetical protein
MVRLKLVIIIVSCIMSLSCSDAQPDVSNGSISITKNPPAIDNLSNTDYNILFVGNSLTYTNDLPELVKKEAELKDLVIGTKMIAAGGYAILDHWTEGEVQKQIKSKKFDFVIIQQGPSSQAFGREVLIEYGEKFKGLCQENDARLSYFMVWPSLDYYETFDGVIKNYQDAASINDAILCAVGKTWKQHFDLTGDFDYYGPDGFHPSLAGSQVAAEVIVEALFP